MKRRALLGHLQEYGCVPHREGGSHSIWINPQTRRKEAIPRHNEIKGFWPAPFAAICRRRFHRVIDAKNGQTLRISASKEPHQNLGAGQRPITTVMICWAAVLN